MSQAARRTGTPAQVIPQAGESENGESFISVLADRVRRLLSVHSQTPIAGLHPTIMREVEKTLLATVLDFTEGHREEASTILGLHRNSLRRRLRAVGLEDSPEPQRRTAVARGKPGASGKQANPKQGKSTAAQPTRSATVDDRGDRDGARTRPRTGGSKATRATGATPSGRASTRGARRGGGPR